MSEGLIDPSAIPIPPVKPEDLRTAAAALKGDGGDISQAGQDIKSAWYGLDGIYSAPEDAVLFAAIEPVATKGDEFDEAVVPAADALDVFADEAERIKTKLEGLKADAQSFLQDIEGDDDWREDEDKVDEHNTLNDDILAALNEYMEAERTCANAITSLFGGTTFVATDPGEEGSVGADEAAYGYTEVPEGVQTPWATPQEHDAPWWEDVGNGIKDFAVGAVEDVGALIGVYGQDGWKGLNDWGVWWENIKTNWGGMFQGLGSLAGVYGENGWGAGSFGEWWDNFSTGWTEFFHAIVPWREWDDRPGYVITQAVLNIGSMALGGYGVYKALVKGGRAAGGNDSNSSDGDSDGSEQNVDMETFQRIGDGSGETAQDLQNSLDELGFDEGRLEGLEDSLDEAEALDNELSPVGGGETIDAHGDVPGGGGGGSGGDSTPDGDSPDGDGSSDPADPVDTDSVDNDGSDAFPDADATPDADGTPDGDADPDGDTQDESEPPDGDPHPDPVPDPPLSQTYEPPGAFNYRGFDYQGETARVGFTDDNGYYKDDMGNVYADVPESLKALEGYQNIRATEGDTAEISEYTGIDQSILDRVKQHLFFNEYAIATDPGTHHVGLFAPLDQVARLWQEATAGDFSKPGDPERFQRLIIHELVESALMEQGLPFRSTHPGYYDKYTYPAAGSHHFGAHDVAPGENGNMWAITDRIGIQRPDFEISDDLSNLDRLVDHLMREIGHE